MDQATYRATAWTAVGTLWNGFGTNAEQMITSVFPQAAPFVDEMYADEQPPEWTAVQIVMQVVPAWVEHKMAPDDRRAALVELQQIIQMGFEQAEGHMALPFVAHVQQAWEVALEWANAGTVPPDTAKNVLGCVIRALAGTD